MHSCVIGDLNEGFWKKRRGAREKEEGVVVLRSSGNGDVIEAHLGVQLQLAIDTTFEHLFVGR